MEAYREGLSDLPEADLREVFSRAILECKFMPTVAELRGFLNRKEVAIDKLESEREWDRILAHVVKYGAVCYPSDSKLEVSAAGEYSLRQIGGADWRQAIAGADDDRLHWLRKNFIECWNRYAETGGLKAIGREEAKRMLDIAKCGHLLAKGDV